MGAMNGYNGSPNHGLPVKRKEDPAIIIGAGCIVAAVVGVFAASIITGGVLLTYAYFERVGPWAGIIGTPCVGVPLVTMAAFFWAVFKKAKG